MGKRENTVDPKGIVCAKNTKVFTEIKTFRKVAVLFPL